MFFKKKRDVIDDEEKLLEYLLKLDRDEENIAKFGLNRYKQVPGFTPEQVVQTMVAFEELGLIKTDFRGPASSQSFCFIKLLEPGLTYFIDQEIAEQEEKSKNAHDYLVQLFSIIGSGIVGFIIGRLTA